MKTLSKITGTDNTMQNAVVLLFGIIILSTLTLLVAHLITTPSAVYYANF